MDSYDSESRRIFKSIFRSLQDVHSFAPLESQVENYLEKNLPENPKENERTRPHGKVEKAETTRKAWNSAETMRRTTAERRAAAENIFMHFHAFSCIFMYFHVCAIRSMQFLRILNISMHFETVPCNTKRDERSQRRACKHFHAISKMTQGHTPE